MSQVCRVCLKNDLTLYNLTELVAVDAEGNEVPLQEMLSYCCSVEFNEQFPLLICTSCSDACIKAYDFIKLFRKNNDIFELLKKNTNEQISGEFEEIKIEIVTENDNFETEPDTESENSQTSQNAENSSTLEAPNEKIVNVVHFDDENIEHKCPVCKNVFTLYSELMRHLRLHPNEEIKCLLCEDRYTNLEEFDVHYFKAHYNCCAMCKMSFITRNEYIQHKYFAHDKVFANNIFAIKRLNSANKKSESLANQKSDSSVILQQKKSISDFQNSQRNQSLNSETQTGDDSENAPKERLIHTCPVCNTGFVFYVGLMRHIKEHTGIDIMCHKCQTVCKSPEDFEAHYFKNHYNYCSICKRSFPTRNKYKNHKASWHKELVTPRIFRNRQYKNAKVRSLEAEKEEETNPDNFIDSYADTRKHKCPVCKEKYVLYKYFRNHIQQHREEEFVCHLCGNQSQNSDEFEKHYYKDHYNYCSICNIGFPTRNKYKNHKAATHRDLIKPRVFKKRFKRTYHKCPLCKHEVFHVQELLTHLGEIHKNQPINCELCTIDCFSTPMDYLNHYEERHIANYCNVCDIKFKSRRNFQDHQRYHVEHACFVISKPHKCPVCAASIQDLDSFKHHLQFCHKGDLIECPICFGVFAGENLYLQHYENEHHIKCENCSERFLTFDQYEAHIQENYVKSHKIDYAQSLETQDQNSSPIKRISKPRRPKGSAKPYSKQRQHICPICAENVRSFRMFHTHIVSHLNECDLEVSCMYCGLTCDNATQFYDHYKSQHYIPCKKCSVYFLDPNSFKNHVCTPKQKYRGKNYGVVKSTFCHTCGKYYAGSLKYHEQNHENKLNYKCDLCHQMFVNYGQWRYHRQKKHQLMQQYLCPHCGRRFVQKVHLTVHLQSHTGIKLYGCPRCGKRFSSINSKNKHVAKGRCTGVLRQLSEEVETKNEDEEY